MYKSTKSCMNEFLELTSQMCTSVTLHTVQHEMIKTTEHPCSAHTGKKGKHAFCRRTTFTTHTSCKQRHPRLDSVAGMQTRVASFTSLIVDACVDSSTNIHCTYIRAAHRLQSLSLLNAGVHMRKPHTSILFHLHLTHANSFKVYLNDSIFTSCRIHFNMPARKPHKQPQVLTLGPVIVKYVT